MRYLQKTLAAIAVLAPTTLANITGETIQIDSGKLEGVTSPYNDNVTVYYGVPYGADTSGQNRFRAPQPVPKWDGIKKFDTYGPVCPDVAVPTGSTAPGTGNNTVSEDCLNFNLWTGATSPKEKLPVYVFLHGGFQNNNQLTYDGTALASHGMVVIGPSRRNTVFGYLATPELSAESGHNASGNYALLDDIAVLEWVKRNVDKFGGDPDHVTIGGHSIGAAHSYLMIQTPLTKGLTVGCISESGVADPNDPRLDYLAPTYYNLTYAETLGLEFQAQNNATSIEDLRKLSIEQLLEYAEMAVLVKDGYVIRRTYKEALLEGPESDVPVLTGSNKDESNATPVQDTNVTAYYENVNTSVGIYGQALENFYDELWPADTDIQADNQTNNFLRNISIISPSLAANLWIKTAKNPFYTYYWTHAPPNQTQGAFHGSELPYNFGNLYIDTDYPWTDVDYYVQSVIMPYWVNFIKTGNPNSPGLVEWQPNKKGPIKAFHIGTHHSMWTVPTKYVKFMNEWFNFSPTW